MPTPEELRTAWTPVAPLRAASSGKGNQGLDFLGRHARHFGHHRDARAVQVGEHVDGQVIQVPAAVPEHENRRGDDEQPMMQRKTDNGIEHGAGVPLQDVDHSAFPPLD